MIWAGGYLILVVRLSDQFDSSFTSRLRQAISTVSATPGAICECTDLNSEPGRKQVAEADCLLWTHFSSGPCPHVPFTPFPVAKSGCQQHFVRLRETAMPEMVYENCARWLQQAAAVYTDQLKQYRRSQQDGSDYHLAYGRVLAQNNLAQFDYRKEMGL
jgi:hypothetical protein